MEQVKSALNTVFHSTAIGASIGFMVLSIAGNASLFVFGLGLFVASVVSFEVSK